MTVGALPGYNQVMMAFLPSAASFPLGTSSVFRRRFRGVLQVPGTAYPSLKLAGRPL